MSKYAKTLYKPERPSDINDKVNAFTNNPLPHFFKYAKDKTDNQVVDANLSFVNKLENIIPNPRINTRKLGLGEIDCTMLMHDTDIEFDIAFTDNGRIIEEETDPLIVEYCKFDKKYYMNVDSTICSGKVDKNDAYMKTQMKNNRITTEIKDALSKFGYDEREIVDILVKFLYGIKKSANKTALWLCYGDVIYENLSEKFRMPSKELRCPDCGEWFSVPFRDNRTVRCPECEKEHKREQARIRQARRRERQKSENS